MRTTRQLTTALAFTALLILGHLMPSFAQNQSPVERVQLPNWDLSDKLDLLHDICPDLRFFYDETTRCWVAEGPPSGLDLLAEI